MLVCNGIQQLYARGSFLFFFNLKLKSNKLIQDTPAFVARKAKTHSHRFLTTDATYSVLRNVNDELEII